MKTIDEIRRENLGVAIKRAKNAARLAAEVGTAPAYLSQIKNASPDSKTGTPKTMGDDMARRIETAIGESTGWMDRDHSAANDAPEVVPSYKRKARLQLVEDDEDELLHEFRMMAPEVKATLLSTAKSFPKLSLLRILGVDKT